MCIAKKPNIFVIFSGGSRPPVPPLDPRMYYADLLEHLFQVRDHCLFGLLVLSTKHLVTSSAPI